MPALDELITLIGPPTKAPPKVDWAAAQKDVGFTFPPDYKLFVETYSALYIDEFVTVFHPGITVDDLNIITVSEGYLKNMRELREAVPEAVPYPIHPEPGGIYLWGVTSNGDWLFWLPAGAPNDWTTVAMGSGGWAAFDGSMTEFLAAVLARRSSFALFPSSFPEPNCTVHEY